MSFQTIAPEQISENVFSLIGKDWMLVTSAKEEGGLTGGKDYNTMTASWGGMGVLWGKPVAFVFVRPQRHTFSFTENNSLLTLSFFPPQYRNALSFCGTKSGREYDKAKECGLTPVEEKVEGGRYVSFDEAKLVLKTRILYREFLKDAAFLSEEARALYQAGDFHRMYICGIEEAMIRS